jgi:hypothetical protein
LQAKVDILQNETLHATEAWRANRESVYADIFIHCAQGLGQSTALSLPQRVAVARAAHPTDFRVQLGSLLRQQLDAGERTESHDIAALADCLAHYFAQSQALLDIGLEIQESINRLLGRAPALWAFSAADLDVHVLLQGSEARRLPHLLEELEDLLGFKAVVTRSGVSLHPGSTLHRPVHDACTRLPEFADMVLADTRA